MLTGPIRTFSSSTFAECGGGLILWGMDDVSPKLVVRVSYIMAVLDAAMLALLTLVMGGFDSVLYWVSGARGAKCRHHSTADVQVVVNLIVSILYLVAGILELMAMASEGTNPWSWTRNRNGGVFDESDVPVTESLVLRILLLVLMTACCAGIQILVDRQRQRELGVP